MRPRIPVTPCFWKSKLSAGECLCLKIFESPKRILTICTALCHSGTPHTFQVLIFSAPPPVNTSDAVQRQRMLHAFFHSGAHRKRRSVPVTPCFCKSKNIYRRMFVSEIFSITQTHTYHLHHTVPSGHSAYLSSPYVLCTPHPSTPRMRYKGKGFCTPFFIPAHVEVFQSSFVFFRLSVQEFHC